MGVFRTVISNYVASLAGLALLIMAWTSECTVAAQASSDKVVAEWIGGLRAAGATVTTEGLDIDPKNNSVQLRGVKVTFPSESAPQKFSLDIGRLELTGPAESEARYAAEALRADDVTIAYGGLSGTAKFLALGDVSVPKLSLKLQDPQHPFGSILALLKDGFQTSWDSLSITGVKVPLGDSPNSMISVDGIAAANVRDGVLGKLELSGIALAAESASTQMSFGRLTFANLALKSLTDALSAGPTGAPKPDWIALVDSITLGSFDLRAPGRHIELPQAKITGVRVHPFPFDVAGYFDRAAVDPQFLAQHPDDRRKFAESLLQAVKVDQVSVQSFSIDDAQSPATQQLTCQDAEIGELDPLNAGSAVLTDIHGRNGALGLTIDRVDASDMRLLEVEPAKSGEIAPPRALYVGGGSLEGVQLGKSGAFIKLENFRFHSADHIGIVPTALDGAVVGLTIPVEVIANPGMRGLLSGLGLPSLAIDADFRASWNEAEERITVSRASVAVQNIGQLEVEGSVSGVPKATLEHPETLASNLSSAAIERIRLLFEDKGFVARLLNAYAVANKSTPEQMRRALTANMPVILGAIPQPEVRNDLIFALVGFLNAPQTLEIVSTAPTPVPVAALAAAFSKAPATIPGLLGLTAKSIH
ncbi:MAG: hypothetical protein ACLPN5_01265, partial [Roseiarcus sp.]